MVVIFKSCRKEVPKKLHGFFEKPMGYCWMNGRVVFVNEQQRALARGQMKSFGEKFEWLVQKWGRSIAQTQRVQIG